VEVAKPRAVGKEIRRRADFLAPLRLEGDGYDAASTGRRLTNDGYLSITLNDYRDVMEACQKGVIRKFWDSTHRGGWPRA
jgi:hypothetical protein